MTNVPNSTEGRGERDASPGGFLDTRALVLLVVSVGGAYLASSSPAWAVGIAAFVAIATLLNVIVRR